MTVEELLAVLLGTGSRGRTALALAHDLVTRTGGLAGLSSADPDELTAVPGIGTARAARLSAAFQLGLRAADAQSPEPESIHGAEHVYRRLRGRLAELPQELFIALALDARNAVVAELEVARGTLTGVEVHPRELFRPLIRLAAAAVVVVHNHPSGDPTPSPEDIELTQRLAAVGQLVGIPVLDHVVIARRGYRSLAEHLA